MPGLNGLVVMKPTSIASTGTGNSSSIGANGKVTFSSCATLSLNGVFTSSYDNYMVCVRATTDQVSVNVYGRLRLSGTDASTNYTYQYLSAGSTTITAARSSFTYWIPTALSSTTRNGFTDYIFGPGLAQPTAMRCVSAYSESSAAINDIANTHSTSTAYDGFTYSVPSGTFTGLVTVYGFNQ